MRWVVSSTFEPYHPFLLDSRVIQPDCTRNLNRRMLELAIEDEHALAWEIQAGRKWLKLVEDTFELELL